VTSERQGRDIVDYASAEASLAAARSRALRYSAIAHQRHAASAKKTSATAIALGW
jgi:hypothetical protein